MVATRVAVRGQLPAETDELIGRAAELRQVDGLLRDARLVTLTGPGGVGKTRVTIRAARVAAPRYPDGVCFVELSALRNPELLPHAIGRELELPEQSLAAQRDALLGYLRDRRLLLILDTCEHLIDACAELAAAIVAAAPLVTVLATSREPLSVDGEVTFQVQPLPVSGPGGEAVDLFERRAAAAAPGFAVTDANRADVTKVCQELDGIPLAIEMAAGRLRDLTLAEILGRLDRRLALLTRAGGGQAGRHATVRNVIAWSYDTCTAEEQALWARLSVFPGSFDVAAATEVCTSSELSGVAIFETIIRLVDKSLLVPVDSGQAAGDERSRFRMLDTIREYGEERLAADGDASAIRQRFIARYLAMARHFEENVFSDEQVELFAELRREHANIQAALGYALAPGPGQGDRARDGGELAVALWAYWESQAFMVGANYWLTKALERATAPTQYRARLLWVRSFLNCTRGAIDLSIADAHAGIELAKRLNLPLLAGRCQVALSTARYFAGDGDGAVRAGKAAERLLTPLGDQTWLILLDTTMVGAYQAVGKPDKAIYHYRRGIARFADGSTERLYHGYLHITAGITYLAIPGKEAECARALSLALRAKFDLDDVVGTAYSLELLGWLAARSGRHERAAWLLGAADPLWTKLGARLSGAAHFEQQHQDAVQAVRGALGDNAFAALFDAGARHPLEQVVALAINDADTLRSAPASQPWPSALTDREREVAYLAAVGLSAEQVAGQLFTSPAEVTGHLRSIFAKLGISSADQLGPWLDGVDGGDGGDDAPAVVRDLPPGRPGKR